MSNRLSKEPPAPTALTLFRLSTREASSAAASASLCAECDCGRPNRQSEAQRMYRWFTIQHHNSIGYTRSEHLMHLLAITGPQRLL